MNEWRNPFRQGHFERATESARYDWETCANERRNMLVNQNREYVPANRDSLERFRERMKARAREVGARIPGDANPIRRPVWD